MNRYVKMFFQKLPTSIFVAFAIAVGLNITILTFNYFNMLEFFYLPLIIIWFVIMSVAALLINSLLILVVIDVWETFNK